MQRGYSYAKQKKNIKLPPLKLIAVIIAFLLISIFIYVNFIKSEKTIISGFNWSDEDIKIVTEDKTIDVQSGSMYKIEVQRNGDLIYSAKNSQGEIIKENRYLIGKKQTIILELISQTENQCIVEADVTDIYYNRNDDTSVKDYTVLNNKKPASTFVYETDHNLLYYVYPGKYSKDILPEAIPKDTPLLGIFFVDCEHIENLDDLNSDILGSIFYETQ